MTFMDPASETNPNPRSADFIMASRRGAISQALGVLDNDPEQAARAMELSSATGVPAPIINGNLENFERQHKAALTASLLNSNDYLRSFINDNPMAAQAANDDYAHLDALSQKVNDLGFVRNSVDNAIRAMLKPDPGFMAGFGEAPFPGSWIEPKDWEQHPDASRAVAAIASPVELLFRTIPGVITAAATEVAGQEEGEKLAQVILDPGLQATLMGVGPPGAIGAGVLGLAAKFHGPMVKIRPWAENGREPPPGVVKDYDKFLTDRNVEDLDGLKEATKEAQQSVLRERSPELFKRFIEQHTDAEIGISGEAVAALYGEKLPTADDNLLGWVPGIVEKLELARETGTDVRIPLADWLAHIEPEVMDALKEDIRVRPNGITTREAQRSAEVEVGAPKAEPLPGEIPSVRGATALEPMFSVGDRKLTLNRIRVAVQSGEDIARREGVHWDRLTPEQQQQWNAEAGRSRAARFGPEQGFHDFKLTDQNGRDVGTINLSEAKGGKQLYVEMINGIGGLGPRDFGPALMRSLLMQLKAEFPNAESITGHRVSGAREKLGTWEGKSAQPVVKLDNPKGWDTVETASEWRRLLEGGRWETYSHNTRAYIKPFAERSVDDQKIIEIVNEELNRIVPLKTDVQAADRIEAKKGEGVGKAIEPSGIYLRYMETYPIILYSLEHGDPLGTARHEAIHHLRNYGFFEPAEWSILEQAAKDNGWIDRFGIRDRYPKGTTALHLEESIADAYKAWERGADAPTPEVHGVFEKMKAFFSAIRKRLGELFGKDPTWEDIFQKVSTGEIGGREGTEPLDPLAFNERAQVPEEFQLKNLPERPANENVMGEPPHIKHGYTTAAYRGIRVPSNMKVKTIHEGAQMYSTSSPEVASMYSGHDPRTNRYAPGAQVMPLQIDTREYHQVDAGGKPIEAIQAQAIREAKAIGKKGVVFNNVFDEPYGQAKSAVSHTVYATFPEGLETVKSRFARRFDRSSLDAMLSVPEEPQGGSRVFERAAALGMTVDQFRRYDELMQQRHGEDIAAATKRAMEQKGREQTKEWKENRKALRQEVAGDIAGRPDVAADLFFGAGELYGKKVPMASVKLDETVLTSAQKAALPRQYYGAQGLHPDDVANLFGYGSGQAMLDHLTAYNQAKLTAGMSAKDFVSRVVDIETDRQMQQRYGNLEHNIIDAVNEQVTGETQQNLLHEETLKLGLASGKTLLDKTTILQQLREQFAKMPLGSVDSMAYMRAAGKAGREAEFGLLGNDPEAAFRAKQQQYYATVIANEAAKLEKELGKFDKLAKRFSAREVTSVDQEYTNFVHDILLRVGRPVRRSIQDLETEIAAGRYKDLKSFVEGKQGFYLREVAVADILLDPAFRKKFEDLTVDEFNAVNTSIRSLVANGRDERKITKAGEKADLEVVKAKMIQQLQEFQEKTYDAKGGRSMVGIPSEQAAILRTFGIDHLQMESIFHRWDRGDPNGVFQQYVMRDLVAAANSESATRKVYAKRLLALDDGVDLKGSIDNPLFKVPGTEQLMKFNRANLRAILLNVGNDSNLSKLARGYKVPKEQVLAWVHQHATKEDWDWAQKMGDTFADLKNSADMMYRQLSGVAPESITFEPIDTPHGQYKGWYYPLIAHPEFEGGVKKLMGKDALEQDGYVRATTANGYTKARTGVAYPLALDLDMLPNRIGQMIHDTEMRPAVINAAKIFYDKDIRSAIFTRFGAEWRDMLTPYLVDVANGANYMPKNQARLARVSEFIRQNMITTLVGLNPGTFLKHTPTALVQSIREVGTGKFLQAMRGLWSVNERTGESNWNFAMRESQELQRRHTHFQETLGGAGDQLVPSKGFASLRSTVNYYASYPVAMGDLLSAVPTWMAQYTKEIIAGETEGEAVYRADKAVRRAHGSTAITNRSAVMRGGYNPWLASVYGFFNHIMNRQYEMVWKAGDALDLIQNRGGTYADAMKQGRSLTANLFAYVVVPAIIEELVSPLSNDEHESWGKKAAKGLGFTLSSSWIGIRDLANGLLNGKDPSIGLASTAFKTLTDVFRDVVKDRPLSKEHAGKLIKDASTLLGTSTGLLPAEVGKVAEFGYGVGMGTERPKGPWGWMTGARYGSLKDHPATYQEWQRHHFGGR